MGEEEVVGLGNEAVKQTSAPWWTEKRSMRKSKRSMKKRHVIHDEMEGPITGVLQVPLQTMVFIGRHFDNLQRNRVVWREICKCMFHARNWRVQNGREIGKCMFHARFLLTSTE